MVFVGEAGVSCFLLSALERTIHSVRALSTYRVPEIMESLSLLGIVLMREMKQGHK